MASNHRFSDVDEALAILPVAAQMNLQSSVKECMEYLHGVRWSPAQEAKLREMLPSLQIDILPDLAARLGVSQNNSEILEQSLQEMLSAICNGSKYCLPCSQMEKYIVRYFEAANASPDSAAANTCRSALLKEFTAIVQRIKSNEFGRVEENYNSENAWAALLWVIKVIQRCDRKLFETVFQMFCEDSRLRLAVRFSSVSGILKLQILMNMFLKALGSGEIIVVASLRVSFLTKWADTIVLILKWSFAGRPNSVERSEALQRGMIDVAETLPFVEQRRIYVIWRDILTAYSVNPSIVLKWWAEKLQDAIRKPNIISDDFKN